MVNTRVFFFFFLALFPTGCLGLISGFFFLFLPFSGGLPRVNTRVFFIKKINCGWMVEEGEGGGGLPNADGWKYG